ncbi:MAG: hypothetical protein MUC86_17295, partial [Burkholderiaceae bacterium]|nr:hypothetical protein [Burkholderiaceae bacterium]
MRVAMDFLSPFNTAGAPVAADLARTAADRRLERHVWRADDLPADDAALARPSGFAALDAELPGGGWPQGQLVELLLDTPGLGELSLLAPALAAVSAEQRACVWVLPVQAGPRPAARVTSAVPLPYAPALRAAGIALARCMFVQPATPRESAWA